MQFLIGAAWLHGGYFSKVLVHCRRIALCCLVSAAQLLDLLSMCKVPDD